MDWPMGVCMWEGLGQAHTPSSTAPNYRVQGKHPPKPQSPKTIGRPALVFVCCGACCCLPGHAQGGGSRERFVQPSSDTKSTGQAVQGSTRQYDTKAVQDSIRQYKIVTVRQYKTVQDSKRPAQALEKGGRDIIPSSLPPKHGACGTRGGGG